MSLDHSISVLTTSSQNDNLKSVSTDVGTFSSCNKSISLTGGRLVLRKSGSKLMILQGPRAGKCIKQSEDGPDIVDESFNVKDELHSPEHVASNYINEINDTSNNDETYSDSLDFKEEPDSLGSSESETESISEKKVNSRRTRRYLAICDICGLEFKGEQALTSHRKWKHTNVVKHECEFCHKAFRDSFCLKRHLESVHTRDGNIRENYRSIYCSICDFKAAEGSVVCKHYQTAHGYDMKEKKIRFSDEEEFENWKEEVESTTKSKYVKFRGSRSNRNGTTVTVYQCHRSGYYHSTIKDKRLRSLKSSGSNKINGYCPAMMSCIGYNGQVIVKYISTHIGHNLEIEKIGLTEYEKEYIAQKLGEKVPMDKILEDIKASATNSQDTKRIHLATKKDFYNIVQKFNLKGLAVYSQYQNDRMNLDSWIKQLQKSSNLVRFYKPQDKVSSENPEFKTDDFSLIIASDEQLELLKRYGNNCICVDNEYKVNSNDFELYTILILDEVSESFPCAFIFSSRADDNALRFYFNVIKTIVNVELSPRYFISDWTNSISNAWSSINTDISGRHLFSRWHIEREWKRNLHKIKSKDKQHDVLTKMKDLLNQRTFSVYEEQSQDIISDLYDSYETRAYANYIQKFVCDPYSWACCYRLNAQINESLNIDELHKQIEYYYVKGKKVKCLKKTIHALINYACVKLKERSDPSFQEKVNNKIYEIVSRHEMSLTLQESLIEITDQGWNVLSSSGNVPYRELVTKDDIDCKCHLVCPECLVCTHSYSCTCSDASISLNMCEHIHLLVTCLKNHTITDSTDTMDEILEVQIVNDSNDSNDGSNLDDDASVASNISEEDFIKESEVGEYHEIDVTTEDNQEGTIEIPAQFEAKKYKFIKRLTNLVNRLETEEELDAVILQNSPLEKIIQNVKEKKKSDETQDELDVPRRKRSRVKQNLFLENNEGESYLETVEEVEQIALEVIVE